MAEANSNIERFLASPTAKVALGNDGFMLEPSEEDRRTQRILTWADLEQVPCVVLLGEPSSGKSTLLEHAGSHLGPIRRVDLGRFNDSNHLESKLDFEAWLAKVPPEGQLHVFLDGLDECLMQVQTAARILTARLKELHDRSRLRLRIACRTGSWQEGLRQELERLFNASSDTPGVTNLTEAHAQSTQDSTPPRSKNLAVLELLPLRRSDAVVLLQQWARSKRTVFEVEEFSQYQPLAETLKPTGLDR